MSPRAAWEQLRGASVAASNEVACASLTTLFLALQCLMEVKPIAAEWQANGREHLHVIEEFTTNQNPGLVNRYCRDPNEKNIGKKLPCASPVS